MVQLTDKFSNFIATLIPGNPWQFFKIVTNKPFERNLCFLNCRRFRWKLKHKTNKL